MHCRGVTFITADWLRLIVACWKSVFVKKNCSICKSNWERPAVSQISTACKQIASNQVTYAPPRDQMWWPELGNWQKNWLQSPFFPFTGSMPSYFNASLIEPLWNLIVPGIILDKNWSSAEQECQGCHSTPTLLNQPRNDKVYKCK